jgi:hypothetical protein
MPRMHARYAKDLAPRNLILLEVKASGWLGRVLGREPDEACGRLFHRAIARAVVKIGGDVATDRPSRR